MPWFVKVNKLDFSVVVKGVVLQKIVYLTKIKEADKNIFKMIENSNFILREREISGEHLCFFSVTAILSNYPQFVLYFQHLWK